MFAVRIYPAMSRSIVMNISFFATLHTAHDQQQCSDAVLFQPWDDVWLVRYNKWPCNPNWPWAAFCEDSGWRLLWSAENKGSYMVLEVSAMQVNRDADENWPSDWT